MMAEYKCAQYLGMRAIKSLLANDTLNGLKQPCITTVHITVGKKKQFSNTYSLIAVLKIDRNRCSFQCRSVSQKEKKQPFLNKAALKSSCDWFTLTSSAFRYSVKGKSLRDEDNYVRLTYMFKFNDLMQLLKAATITAQY